MCQLKRHLKRPKKGYKIVVLKGYKKYSPAMGIEYEDGEPVKIPKKQHKLAKLYSSKILDPKAGHGFSQHMVGRTAIFKDSKDAWDLFWRMKNSLMVLGWNCVSTPMALFEATVSTDVMSGVSSKNSKIKVYAGRVISFGERLY